MKTIGGKKKPRTINAIWHSKNRMPKNPSLEQRIKWHKEHLKFCRCRKDVPKSLEKYF